HLPEPHHGRHRPPAPQPLPPLPPPTPPSPPFPYTTLFRSRLAGDQNHPGTGLRRRRRDRQGQGHPVGPVRRAPERQSQLEALRQEKQSTRQNSSDRRRPHHRRGRQQKIRDPRRREPHPGRR